jgi:hypothetical protein
MKTIVSQLGLPRPGYPFYRAVATIVQAAKVKKRYLALPALNQRAG